MKFRVFWDVVTCSHIEVDWCLRGAYCLHYQCLMMKAVCTSDMSVNFNITTWRYIMEDSKLHTCRCKNLKSHIVNPYGEVTLRCFRWFWFIALLMGAVRTSETSVNFNVPTWCYFPEDSKLHTRYCKNLKSHDSLHNLRNVNVNRKSISPNLTE
jgi:hypothetical protein